AGLPGIIAHGLCTMAMSSWGVVTAVARSDVHREKRFAVRFSKIVLPGFFVPPHFGRGGPLAAPTTYAFRTARGSDLVLTDGLAIVAD
ncbi:MaoC/PaaZ C-terminal domain-containing protein, partial [Nocardia cyriacigeorgica]|uniref:MaoC/PaaZ C-terminal domain-containing protein n=1 Tax=Nocardia cyriacigeorgica TaxID=135487 RepID=UPI002453FC9A